MDHKFSHTYVQELCIHSFHSACTAATGKTAVPSELATLCLEIPVSGRTSTWRCLTYVNVSTLKTVNQTCKRSMFNAEKCIDTYC